MDDGGRLPDPEQLRNNTQIRLPAGALDGIEADLLEECTLTVHEDGSEVLLIGSPTEIQCAVRVLSRHGFETV